MTKKKKMSVWRECACVYAQENEIMILFLSSGTIKLTLKCLQG